MSHSRRDIESRARVVYNVNAVSTKRSSGSYLRLTLAPTLAEVEVVVAGEGVGVQEVLESLETQGIT